MTSETTYTRRVDGIVARVQGDETLVLDTTLDTAHCLSGDVARVWAACEIPRSLAQVAAVAGIEESAAEAALAELGAIGLLAAGVSRRGLMRGAAVLTGAGVLTIGLPTAAMATSNNGATPSIVVSPSSGPKGKVITVTGTGFKLGGTIASVTIGGTTVTPSSTTIASNGSFSFTTTVPAGLPVTANSVVVKDNAATPNQATSSYSVVAPAVTLSSTTFAKHTGGGSGSGTFTVTATSSPFAASSSTTVTGSTASGGVIGVTPSPSPVTTTAAGAISSSQTFTISYTNGAGSGSVTFTDAFGNTATVTLTFS